MQDWTHTERDSERIDPSDFDRYADYEDCGDLIVCDRREPGAWIRSDRTETLDP